MNIKVQYFALGTIAYVILLSIIWSLYAYVLLVNWATYNTLLEIIIMCILFLLIVIVSIYFIIGGIRHTLSKTVLDEKYIKTNKWKIHWQDIVSIHEKNVSNYMGGAIPGYCISFIAEGSIETISLVKTKKVAVFIDGLVSKSIIIID